MNIHHHKKLPWIDSDCILGLGLQNAFWTVLFNTFIVDNITEHIVLLAQA